MEQGVQGGRRSTKGLWPRQRGMQRGFSGGGRASVEEAVEAQKDAGGAREK
jgi:hypothetical protein